VVLDVAAGLRDTTISVRQLRAAVGDTALELVGEVDSMSRQGRAALLALAVDASQLRQLAPEAPLAGDLHGTVYLESDGENATAALDLAPRNGGGNARAAAAVRLPPGALAAGGDVHLAGLDLSRVLRGAPPTSITLDGRGYATGRDLDTLDAGLALSLAPSRLRTGRVGPAQVRATVRKGAVEVTRLEVALPGGTLRGNGRWRRRGEMAGQAVLDASDLAALRRNVEGLLARRLPALAGSVRVEADLAGTQSAPAAKLRVTSPRLASPDVAASSVALAGSLSGPLASPAVLLDGTIARLRAGGLDARDLRLRAQAQGGAGEVSVTASVPELGKEPLALSAKGGLSKDKQVLQLTALTLGIPRDRFELQGPARVDLEGPSVDRLALASGSQQLVLTGGVTGKGRRRALAARARLEGLDLALLPKALLPPGLGLAGRVDADVTARGRLAAPQVSGRVELAQGAAMGFRASPPPPTWSTTARGSGPGSTSDCVALRVESSRRAPISRCSWRGRPRRRPWARASRCEPSRCPKLSGWRRSCCPPKRTASSPPMHGSEGRWVRPPSRPRRRSRGLATARWRTWRCGFASRMAARRRGSRRPSTIRAAARSLWRGRCRSISATSSGARRSSRAASPMRRSW
jgi:autotransporter translocation and assembly factor TamB